MAKIEIRKFVEKSSGKKPSGPGIQKTEKFGRTISKPVSIKGGNGK
jgi:hypothetical protein